MNKKIRVSLLFLLLSLLSGNLYAQGYTWASFPQIAFGGGCTTYLTVSDPLPSGSRVVYVNMYDKDGDALTATVDQGIGEVPGAFSFTLDELAVKTFAITKTGSTVAGRLEVAAEGIERFNSSLRYSITNPSGSITDVVGVLPIEPTNDWTITVDKRQDSEYIALAIANWWSDVEAEVKFDLYQSGAIVNSVSKPVPALGQLSIYVNDASMFPSFTGLGTLRISSPDVTISVMAIRQDGSQFSSLPADAGTQLWSWSYTDSSTTYGGLWSWRFSEGTNFLGDEQNPWNDDFIKVRGTYDASFAPSPFFILEWWYVDSATDQGTILFQGTPGTEGSKEVINGKRLKVNAAGVAGTAYTFKATRID
jgi:hypothetical protein